MSELPAYRAECAAYISDAKAKLAFEQLIDRLIDAGFDARPYSHGYMSRDISMFQQGERMFSVCAARRWVLVYLRAPALQRHLVDMAALHTAFAHAQPNKRGDIGVRIADTVAAAEFLSLIGLAADPAGQRFRSADELPDADPDADGGTGLYAEGAVDRIAVNAYERNAAARSRCIEHHGCRCVVCGFSFEATYGDLGRGYIHVHHLVAVAARRGVPYLLDPIQDLRPVCPNCHAMLHQTDPPLDIEELAARLRAAASPPPAS